MSEPEETREQVSIRRAPRLTRFLVLGGVLGIVVTFILTASFPADPSIGFGPIFGYFAIYGVIGGLLLGAVVGLIFERISIRRARTLEAEVSSAGSPQPRQDIPE
ncbi:MAG: uncharacterized protein JWR53_573 [Glaciihabitans sp.]|nr:uncharacterized protein [Glaciihabitans sp.]MCU1534092.1 uncharacterized protein [Glaciihabitans sp.]